MKSISFKCANEMVEALEEAATQEQAGVSDIIRRAIEFYFAGEEKRHRNVKALLYEIVKTRAVIIRAFGAEGVVITKELCEQAALDAEAYLKAL